MSANQYDRRKPERLAEMERLAVESIGKNPKIPPRRKASCRAVIRALYGRARRDGTRVVPGGERSLLEVTGIRRRETIRKTLDILDKAGELTDVTPGEPGSARRRAHHAAGKQSEYRLRDHTLTGRKAATTGHAATVKTGHASPTVAGLGTVETGPSTTNIVRLGYSPTSKGRLVSYKESGSSVGLSAAASPNRPTSSIAEDPTAQVDLQSLVTDDLPRRAATRALVFRSDLSPLCREIYLTLTAQPAKVNHLAKALNTAWSNVNACLRKLAVLGLARDTGAGWILGDADPFTAHTTKAAAKASSIREENRRHHQEQELIRAEYNEKRETAAPIVQHAASVEVAIPEPPDEDNAPVVSDAGPGPKSCEHGTMILGKSGRSKKNGRRWQIQRCPQEICKLWTLVWEVGQEMPAGWVLDTAVRVLEVSAEQCDNEPVKSLDRPAAFERLIEGTRCQECGGRLPFGEEHTGIHFTCEFPDAQRERQEIAV